MTESIEQRFEVRQCNWGWLPDWLVIDTEKQVRAAAYNDEKAARADCAERNADALTRQEEK